MIFILTIQDKKLATFGAQLHPSNFVAIDTLKTAGEGVQHSGARNVRAGSFCLAIANAVT